MSSQLSFESYGINIGSFKSIFSKSFKPNNKFQTEVLLNDDSSRIIPSIICYSDTHRLYGETAKSLYKKNFKTSYIDINRLMNFYEDNLISKESEFMLFGTYLNNGKFLCYNNEKLEPLEILTDYLSLINSFYIKQGIIIKNCVLSVPDYYLEYQRYLLKKSCEAIGINNIKIINESTAITMYYGYTKYKDMFVTGKVNVNSQIQKNIIFIDIGHSKTSFIYSTFTYDKFKVKKVKCIPFLGGRNFNLKIKDECLKCFCNKFNYKKDEINKKSIVRLLEIIEKERIKLTVNKEIMINVESFENGEDLEYLLTKEKFEQLIKEEVKEFTNTFKEFKKEISELNNGKIPENIIIEMAGDLFRTPILQEEIMKCFDNKISISKTIIVDECASIGASLMGYYIFDRQNFPIITFKKIEGYNYLEIIYDKKLQNYGNKDENILKIPFDTLKNNSNILSFNFDYKDQTNGYVLKLDCTNLSYSLNEKNNIFIKNYFSSEDLKVYLNEENNLLIINKDYFIDYKINVDTNSLKTIIDQHNNNEKNYYEYIEKMNSLYPKFYKRKAEATEINNQALIDFCLEKEKDLRKIQNKKNISEKIKDLKKFKDEELQNIDKKIEIEKMNKEKNIEEIKSNNDKKYDNEKSESSNFKNESKEFNEKDLDFENLEFSEEEDESKKLECQNNKNTKYVDVNIRESIVTRYDKNEKSNIIIPYDFINVSVSDTEKEIELNGKSFLLKSSASNQN